MDNQRFEQLLIKELTGVLSNEERQELQSFLQTDPIRRYEYQLLKDYWTNKGAAYPDLSEAFSKVKDKIRLAEGSIGLSGDETDGPMVAKPQATLSGAADGAGLAEGSAYSDEPDFSEQRQEPAHRRVWMRWLWKGAAAILIGSLGFYGWYRLAYSHKAGNQVWQEKYAERRTRSQLILSDGSTVLLNSDSRLKFPASFDGHTREVFLSGEAFFDIKKDADHPFIIHADKMNIRVLGTAFNVKSYSNDPAMEATLIRGSIEVTFPDRPSDRIILKPNDKLVLGTHAPAPLPAAASKESRTEGEEKFKLTGLTYYRPHDTTVVETSWTENKLAFRHEAFRDLARRMERWYGVTILFDKQELADITFTGLFEKESIEEALKALQLSEKFQYAIQGTTIHIY